MAARRAADNRRRCARELPIVHRPACNVAFKLHATMPPP
jgi:hypothetical protein